MPKKKASKKIKELIDSKNNTLFLAAGVFLVLVAFLIGTNGINWFNKKTVTVTEDGLFTYKVGQRINMAGYELILNSPRYGFDEDYLMETFKVDATIINNSFTPSLLPIFNCDIVNNGEVILEGSGVHITESHEVFPGERHGYTIIVPLEFDYGEQDSVLTRKVSSCRFSPTGAFDPNYSVEVGF